MPRPTDFPKPIERSLTRIAAAVSILTPELFRVADDLPEMVVSRVTLFPYEPLGDRLVHSLAGCLYDRYYCQPNPNVKHKAQSKDILEALRQANTSREGWDPDWRIEVRNEEGTAVVRRGSCTRLVKREEYQEDGERETSSGAVLLRRPREDRDSQPGFYFAFGETMGDRFEDLVGARIYLSLVAESAAQWVQRLTGDLNAYSVPFSLKVLRNTSDYWRADAGVLYVPRRYAGFASSLVCELSKKLDGLRAGVPLFARRIAPGIAFADSPPGGESFGVSRMRLVAEGIVSAWRNHDAGVQARVRSIAARFRSAGLDVHAPWLNPGNQDLTLAPFPPLTPHRKTSSSGKWLEVAHRLGRRLVRDAIWHRDQCTWLGWFVLPQAGTQEVAFCTAGSDLYSGTMGIALFLARLARITGEERIRAAAMGGFRHAMKRGDRRAGSIGAYSGLAGQLYGTLAIADALANDEAASAATKVWQKLCSVRPTQRELDIVFGRAGAIRVLLHAATHRACRTEALELAVQLGDEILALACREEGAWSWDTIEIPVKRRLIGYSHGTSGIACALYQLAAATGSSRFLEGVHGALRYEAMAFDAKRKDWPDFRRQLWETTQNASSDEDRFMASWCNGAPGIALTLARLSPADRDPALEGYLDAAIHTTLTSLHREPSDSRAGDFSLCHGIAGNADVLLQVHERKSNPSLLSAVLTAAEQGLQRYHHSGNWPCGIEGAGETPGLMVGLAGIAHFYLRLHDPSIESPLIL
jgi:hypothetical protein